MTYGVRKRGFDPITLVGLIFTLLLHGGAIGGILFYRQAVAASQVSLPVESYVVAKLVRLGKPVDAKKLPNKIVPQVATRKDEGVDFTADADDAPSKKKPNKENRDVKISDKIRNSLDKAELLAQAMAEVEAEGSPDGVVGGTASSAEDGDPYMTKIADLWNRTWSLPSIIPRNEAKNLYALVVVRIDPQGKIQLPITFTRRSGSEHFDNSIATAWQQIQQIPLPPPDRYASILANGLRLKLNWKGLQ